MAVIALGVLILCSCRMRRSAAALDLSGVRSSGYATLPPEAFAGRRPGHGRHDRDADGSAGHGKGVPVRRTPRRVLGRRRASARPGRRTNTSATAAISAAGDAGSRGEIRGLQMEDTVARFETLDGQTRVQPSNPVYLYSPRFNAVRQVVNLEDEFQIERLRGVHEPVKLAAPTVEETSSPRASGPPIGDNIGARRRLFRDEANSGAVSSAVGPARFPRPLQGLTRTSPSFARAFSPSRRRPG